MLTSIMIIETHNSYMASVFSREGSAMLEVD